MALVIPLAELRSPLEQSYRNTYYCAGLLEQHTDGRITARYCNNRWCLVCGHVRTARSINGYEPVLVGWRDPHFGTLTLPNVPAEQLAATIGHLVSESAKIARAIRRTDHVPFKALRKVECTHNPHTGRFHPHLHFIVEGREAGIRLRERWLERHPDASPLAQDLRPCTPGSLREFFKYFTKLTTATPDGSRHWMPPVVLDTIFQAMQGRRVYQPMGFTRTAATKDEEAPVGEDEATYAWSRVGDSICWEWSQDLHDWLDYATGCLLLGQVGGT